MPTHAFDAYDKFSRPDTREALRAFLQELGQGVRPAARILQTSHTALVHGADERRPPPTLDTLAVYARRAAEYGLRFTFTVDPLAGVTYKVERIKPKKKIE